jgi:hypothetical protein
LFQGAEPPSVIPLPTADLSIDDPLGIDTYFLLASDEPLPSPEVLEFSGVRRNAGPRAGMDPLARLISRTFQGQRGEAPAVPVNWSLDRLVLRSVGKGEGSAKGR